ncbi:MAG TPA: hypothetical protein VF272_00100 [Candidatus Saccharimonadia bacterium]
MKTHQWWIWPLMLTGILVVVTAFVILFLPKTQFVHLEGPGTLKLGSVVEVRVSFSQFLVDFRPSDSTVTLALFTEDMKEAGSFGVVRTDPGVDYRVINNVMWWTAEGRSTGSEGIRLTIQLPDRLPDGAKELCFVATVKPQQRRNHVTSDEFCATIAPSKIVQSERT